MLKLVNRIYLKSIFPPLLNSFSVLFFQLLIRNKNRKNEIFLIYNIYLLIIILNKVIIEFFF